MTKVFSLISHIWSYRDSTAKEGILFIYLFFLGHGGGALPWNFTSGSVPRVKHPEPCDSLTGSCWKPEQARFILPSPLLAFFFFFCVQFSTFVHRIHHMSTLQTDDRYPTALVVLRRTFHTQQCLLKRCKKAAFTNFWPKYFRFFI